MAFIVGSATFTSGSKNVTGVTVSSGVLVNIASGTMLSVGENPVSATVEAIAAPSETTITLRENWPLGTGTYGFTATFTPEGIRDGIQSLRDATTALENATTESITEAEADVRYLQITDAETEYLTQADAETEYLKTSVNAGKNLLVDGRYDFWYEATTYTSSGASTSYETSTMSITEHSTSTGVTQARYELSDTDAAKIDNPTAIYGKSITVPDGLDGTSGYVLEEFFIEDVRTNSGKDINLSLYLETNNNSGSDISIEFVQNFGSGGSTQVEEIGVTKLAITDTQARYSVTATLPSAAGKAIGNGNYLGVRIWLSAGSAFNLNTDTIGNVSIETVFKVACLQLEAGTQISKFEEKTHSQALRDLNRYYWESRVYGGASSYFYTYATTDFLTQRGAYSFPQEMRSTPAFSYSVTSGSIDSVNPLTATGFTLRSSDTLAPTAIAGVIADARLGG